MSILGQKVKLRPIELSDLPVIKSWRNDTSLMRYFREYRFFSDTQKEDWYNKMIKDDRFEFFIIECKYGKPIGIAGITYIDWVNRHADVHFYIGDESQWIDDIYSDEAFEIILKYGFNNLNLNKLWAEIYEIDNKKLDFFQRKGFLIDANLREHYFYNGKYYTSHILSLLRNEKMFNYSSPSR
jgi:RimJ/RimL family protein N-acetyltransferase